MYDDTLSLLRPLSNLLCYSSADEQEQLLTLEELVNGLVRFKRLGCLSCHRQKKMEAASNES